MTGRQRTVITQGVNVASPELIALPDGWEWRVQDTGRVFFVKGETPDSKAVRTYDHPSFGPLPKPWIFRVSNETKNGRRETWTEYYNRDTQKASQRDPRGDKNVLSSEMLTRPRSDAIRGSLYRPKPGDDLSTARRTDIGTNNNRDDYLTIKVLDPGDGSKGGMNGGVYSVCLKSNLNRFYVEKRFTKEQYDLAVSEIRLLHKLRHGSLTTFTDAFMDPVEKIASVYVEFCDLGDLSGIIKAYSLHESRAVVPEQFIWHVFIGLVDGLAFLQGGRKFLTAPDYNPRPGWVPILHRDMKPDNVLLRSRSTLSSSKYPYCVISDFGLAGTENDWIQKGSGACGTSLYFAPELCLKPYPKNEYELTHFTGPYKHSAKSDLWAVGASVFNLAELDFSWSGWPTHLNGNIPPEVRANIYKKEKDGSVSQSWLLSFQSRKELVISNEGYTVLLEQAVLKATDLNPELRPTPIEMIKYLRDILKNKVLTKHLKESSSLPSWALTKHEYHALAVKAMADLATEKNKK